MLQVFSPPPNYLNAQASEVFKSQNNNEYLHHSSLGLPQHNNRTYFDEQNKIMYFGTTIFNQSTNRWDVLIQAMDYNGGQYNGVIWKDRINSMLPSQLNFQFHSMTGDNNSVYITITSNTSLYGTTDELHVLALNLNNGLIKWHYNNGSVDGNGLVRDLIIETDNNGDLIIGFLKKAVSSPAVQYAGLIKLDILGNEYWAKGSTIPTPYQGGQFLELHDIGHESANGKYVITGVFDHSASSTDIGIFSIYVNASTGVFSNFYEIIPFPVSTCLDRNPLCMYFQTIISLPIEIIVPQLELG